MSALKLGAAWCFAVLVASWVLWHHVRGRRVQLAARVPARVARAAGTLLMLLGCSPAPARDRSQVVTAPAAGEAPPAQTPAAPAAAPVAPPTPQEALLVRPGAPFPVGLSVATLGVRARAVGTARRPGWLALVTRALSSSDHAAAERQLADRVPSPESSVRERLRAHVANLARPGAPPASVEELRGLLEATAARGLYHAPFGAYLWRASRDLRPAGDVAASALATYARDLEEYFRVAGALEVALAATGVRLREPWIKMSMPPREDSELGVTERTLPVAQARHAVGDAGTWVTEATIALRVSAAGTAPVLHRSGHEIVLGPGTELTLRRLDVVRVPDAAASAALLEHAELGPIRVAPGHALTAWSLPENLEPAARNLLAARVERALQGDVDAIARLEADLPAAHASLRAALARDPRAPGAPALRTLLALFDE